MLKLSSGAFKPFWCQSPGPRVNGWASSGNLMCDIMFEGLVGVAWLGHCWELLQDGIKVRLRVGGEGKDWVTVCAL